MRTPDRGSTTGNASWTDREPASGLPRRNWQRQLDRPRACERAAPQGRAKRVNPPLTAIF
ncbi:hypothetical protein DM065_08730 [Klebsiella pneumoniae]|nr:hypothetical protein DM066_07345 [Klebsiella pneumoniae]RCA05883.1 hypothetical protein DM065_08730 [Klebsiella pneumoniae]